MDGIDEAELRPADAAVVAEIWRPWGLPIVSVGRHYQPEDVEGLVAWGPSGPSGSSAPLGLVTWCVSGAEAEIVTLDAFEQGQGHGTRLLAAAERRCAEAGAREAWLLTTNDNLPALGFYLRRGYRLVRVHLDAMDEVFRVKPARPRTGIGGLPLRDLWELRKQLA